MPRKIEGSRKKERPNMRWIYSIKEAIGVSLQEQSRAVRTGHGGHDSFIVSPGVGANSRAHSTRSVRASLDHTQGFYVIRKGWPSRQM